MNGIFKRCMLYLRSFQYSFWAIYCVCQSWLIYIFPICRMNQRLPIYFSAKSCRISFDWHYDCPIYYRVRFHYWSAVRINQSHWHSSKRRACWPTHFFAPSHEATVQLFQPSISVHCFVHLALKRLRKSDVFAAIFGECVKIVSTIASIHRKWSRILSITTIVIAVPTGVITFTRRSIDETDMPNWFCSTATFDETLLHVTANGTIEDGCGLLQVDFANKFLGGGVLGNGCFQEGIRFVICPELLISRLFTEFLDDNECMIMKGCERFSAYRGYASTFEWTGDFSDNTPIDSSRRRKCTIVAIDAVPNPQHQYSERMLKRELNKVRHWW